MSLTILALTTSYPLRASSWAGIFIERLYARLPASRVVVVCPADDRPTDPRQSGVVSVIPVRYAPASAQRLAQQSGGVAPGLRRHPWRAAWIPPMLASLCWRAIRQARMADLIHANWAICGAMAVLAGRIARRPVVTTFRGDDVKRAMRSSLDRRLLDIALAGSDAVICVSDAMAADLRAYSPMHASKIGVVRNGVDEAFLSVVKVPTPRGLVRVGAVGSLIHRKAFDVLISAIAQMKERANVHLTLVGHGPEREKLAGLAEALGIASNITFAGELAPARMPSFFAGLDLFVSSSRSEGRPNVVIEAAAAALPVISTDLPGVVDLVIPGATGWIVPVDDPPALAAALDDACLDPTRLERMGGTARQRMERDGGWARAAGEYAEIFRRVVDSHRGAG